MTKPNIHGGAAEPAQAALGRGVAATEEQARAILSMAKRVVEEEDGGAGKLSRKRSLEWFLEGRKNKALHRHGDEADDSSSSSSSSD